MLQKSNGLIGKFHIHELSANQCRWPVNDGPPHLFCGDHGFPYCEHHAALSRGNGTEAERSALRGLKKYFIQPD